MVMTRAAGLATSAAIAAAVSLFAVTSAAADQCVDKCRAANNQCRIATKGTSSACDSQMQACIDGCRARR